MLNAINNLILNHQPLHSEKDNNIFEFLAIALLYLVICPMTRACLEKETLIKDFER